MNVIEDAVSSVTSPTLNVFPQLEVRYSDGYKAAKAIIGFGSVVKIAGAVAGVIIALVGFSLPGALVVGGVVFGGLIWLGVFVGGVVICAQGQLLLATLDSAVNNSPFLDNPQRASIMSLSANPTSWSRTPDSSEAGAPLQHTGLRCGKCNSFGPKVVAISPELAQCKSCGNEWNPMR